MVTLVMLEKLTRLSVLVLGFDAFCLNKKFLVLNLVDRNLKIKYRRSFLGFFWTILSPIAMSLIYYFVFKVILKVERPHYLAFILCGVMPWGFFIQSITESTESIVSNGGLLIKIPMPIHVFPYVTSITNFSTLALSIPVIFGAAYISGNAFTLNSLWLFYFFIELMLFTYALGAILSLLYVYFRDLKHAIGLIMQLWFYSTPVLYDANMLPEKYRWLLFLNPVGCIFEGIHEGFINGQAPHFSYIAVSFGWTMICFLALRVIYIALKPGLVERV